MRWCRYVVYTGNISNRGCEVKQLNMRQIPDRSSLSKILPFIRGGAEGGGVFDRWRKLSKPLHWFPLRRRCTYISKGSSQSCITSLNPPLVRGETPVLPLCKGELEGARQPQTLVFRTYVYTVALRRGTVAKMNDCDNFPDLGLRSRFSVR